MAEPTKLALVPRNLAGEDARTEVVRFLRSVADAVENGEEEPAHKAVLVLYADVGDKFAIRSRYCNVTAVERTAMLSMATYDVLAS